MRISLLLQREPFAQILEQTLANYWSEQSGRTVTVQWQQGKRSAARQAGQSQRWYVNSYLNAIFASDADATVFEPIQREFSRSLVWWKRPLQQIYVTLATRPQSAAWLAQATITVTPDVAKADQLLVLGGNHKLRILQRSLGQVVCLLKAGFDHCFWERELETRQQAAQLGLPVPQVLVIAENRRWFAEAYVSGTPLNRLASRQQAHERAGQAATQLQRLLQATCEEVPLQVYGQHLLERIERLLQANRLLSSAAKTQILTSCQVLAQRLQPKPGQAPGMLTTALTHGDFQPANLLVNEQGVWLIDWEYATRRQSGYDALVFGLQARFPKGLAERLQRWVQIGWPAEAALAHLPWLGLTASTPMERLLQANCFLLEEVLLHLEENSQPRLTQCGTGLQQYQVELTDWLELNLP